MKLNKTRLEELKDSECRGSRAIYKAIVDSKVQPKFDDLLPFVVGAYQTGKHRGMAYIRSEVKDTLKWLSK